MDFYTITDRLFFFISNSITEQDITGERDVDESSGIVSISYIGGTYIINRQSAVKQVWLSSPISGPHHFSLIKDRWVSRNDLDLLDILQKELMIDLSSYKL